MAEGVAEAVVTRCKCCGSPAYSYGRIDFHKSCESRHREVFPPSGVLIEYHRCPACQFLFTTDFDGFTTDDLRRHIYNVDYPRVDPEYLDVRPRNNAATLCNLFQNGRPRRILDYGGGEGRLAELLRGSGFEDVVTYDPFVERFASLPEGPFDCILCFEVLEHATEPRHVLEEIAGSLDDAGMVFFSTLLQPPDIAFQGLRWWYAGPRNGHVSLFSKASLEALVRPLGLRLGSFSEGFHVLLRGRPDFLRHLA